MFETIKSQIYKHYIIMIREIGELSHLFIYPMIGLLPLSLFTNFIIGEGAPLESMYFVVIGVFIWNFYAVSQRGITYGLLWEWWSHSVKSLFTSKMKVNEFIIGSIIVGFITGLISGLFVLLVSAVFFNFNPIGFGLWVVPALLIVLLNASSEGLILDSLVILKGPRYRALIWIIPGIIMVFCGIYYPVSLVPMPLRLISYALPTTYAVQGLRDAFMGSVNINDFIIGGGLSIVYIILTTLFFKYTIKKGKETGLLPSLD